MSIMGTLLKNRRAGEAGLAWNLPALAGPETLQLSSPAFADGAPIPLEHAGKRIGGREASPPLSWSQAPEGTAELLLVMEDIDVPMGKPFVHLVALVDPTFTALAAGALNPATAAGGVRLLKSTMGRGYMGPSPIKGHGPHRYVFQLFALAAPAAADGASAATPARVPCSAPCAARCLPAPGLPAPTSANTARENQRRLGVHAPLFTRITTGALPKRAARTYRWRMPSLTEDFCAALLRAARGPLPPPVERAARRSLLNVLGTAVSAAGSAAVGVLLAAADEAGGAGDVTVPGLARTLDPYWGALATGTSAHLDDFDDTHLATVIHPGASALATVLSLVPETAPTGAAFLGAFAAGCEAQLRIGCAISPAHYDHGWHITGTCGVFGAAVAASALLGLDAQATARALSLAATMTAGHREAFGTMTKPLHAGKAAANGVLAARLAAAGLAGPADPLGEGGVLEVLAARWTGRRSASAGRKGTAGNSS